MIATSRRYSPRTKVLNFDCSLSRYSKHFALFEVRLLNILEFVNESTILLRHRRKQTSGSEKKFKVLNLIFPCFHYIKSQLKINKISQKKILKKDLVYLV